MGFIPYLMQFGLFRSECDRIGYNFLLSKIMDYKLPIIASAQRKARYDKLEYDAKNDVYVSLCELLPDRVKGLITCDRDGNNIILINPNLCESERAETLKHEYIHLFRSDLYSDEPAHVIEGRIS